MSIMGIIIAALIVSSVGLFIGIFLGYSGKIFAVTTDEREEAILEILPGNNCGACGYAGCSGLAGAIIAGEAEITSCPVGGAKIAEKIGLIMGREVLEKQRMTAFVKCAGTCNKANSDYEYYGLTDCRVMPYMQNGGPKSCDFGCMGYGTCVKVCPFDAIHIEDGIAVVDKEECKACGKCIAVCPHHLIELVPYEQKHLVRCGSKNKGKEVISVCGAGCIGCKICEKVCPTDAITVKENIAHIDYDKCTNCGLCAEKCPKKVIL